MTTVYMEREINTPAAAAWARLADLDRLDTLMNIIVGAELDGDMRTLQLSDGGTIVERILGVDTKRRRVGYSIRSSPFGMEDHAASMQIVERDGKTFVVWISDIKPDYVADQLRSTLADEADTMARRLSTRANPDKATHRRRRSSR